MYKTSSKTAALGVAIAMGVLVTDAQADSGSPVTRAQRGPVALNAEQLDQVAAGSFFSVSVLTSSSTTSSSSASVSGGSGMAFASSQTSSTTTVNITSNSGD